MIKFLINVWKLARDYKFRLIVGALAGVASGFAEPLVFAVVALVLSVLFPAARSHQLDIFVSQSPKLQAVISQAQQAFANSGGPHSKLALIFIVSLVPLAILLKSVTTYLNSYLLNWVAVRSIADLRIRLFNHLLNLPLGFFSKTSTGELMSRTSDVSILQNMIGVSLVTLVKEPATVITYLIIPFKLEPKLTLFSMIVFPICIVPIAIYSRKVRKSSAVIQTHLASLSKLMHESFTGNRIVKAYNMEKIVVNLYKKGLADYINHYMRVVRSTDIPGPLIEVVAGIGIAAMFLLLASNGPGSSSPIDFFVFVGSLLALYRPVKALVRLHSQLEQARAATTRVFELMNTQTTILEPANPVALKAAGAEIIFDNINFDYGDKAVLRCVSLTVKPGQMVALVGASGSGKTTLTNLLLRFYDPQQGTIRIGGTDIRQVTLNDLRSQIAVVTQDPILFNDTIGNNIGFGRPGATKEEIEAAARHAHAHDFIMEKPEGYDAPAGEKGANVSGGQRQRLAIARAIVKNAPILVLDEATSALDNESERAVQDALEELMVGRTTICIAHRLSTIQNADVIVVMDQGTIVEMGKHAELLARGGTYSKLYSLGLDKPEEGASSSAR